MKIGRLEFRREGWVAFLISIDRKIDQRIHKCLVEVCQSFCFVWKHLSEYQNLLKTRRKISRCLVGVLFDFVVFFQYQNCCLVSRYFGLGFARNNVLFMLKANVDSIEMVSFIVGIFFLKVYQVVRCNYIFVSSSEGICRSCKTFVRILEEYRKNFWQLKLFFTRSYKIIFKNSLTFGIQEHVT